MGDNLVPPLLVHTGFGLFASDNALGDAILAALRSYVPAPAGDVEPLDPRTVYNLLGDPALRVHRKGQ